MRLGTAIECLFDNYIYASDKEWIRDKVAWALYQTWQAADDRKRLGKLTLQTCANCKFGYEGWFGEMCNSCCSVHSNWQPKTEPQTCENQECKNYDIINDHCRFIEQCYYEPKTELQMKNRD